MTLEAIRAIRRCSHGLARPPKCATKVDPIVALSSGSWKSGLIAAIEWREQAEALIHVRKRLRCNPRYTLRNTKGPSGLQRLTRRFCAVRRDKLACCRGCKSPTGNEPATPS